MPENSTELREKKYLQIKIQMSEFLDHRDDKLRTEDDERDRNAQADDDEKVWILRHSSNGQHIIERHDHVGNRHNAHRLPDIAGFRHIGFVIFVGEQFHRDPEQQKRTAQAQPRNRQERDNKQGEDDAQHNGDARAGDDADRAALGRQAAASQRDHDSIVSGEENVDPDDLQKLDHECADFSVHFRFFLFGLRLAE